MSKIDHSLFSADAHALDAFGPCPKCSGTLQIRRGKSGPFLGCNQYPACDHTQPLHEAETAQVKTIDGSECPLCKSQLAIKKGRYGLFIGCTEFPQCDYLGPITQKQDTHVTCPQCGKGSLLERTNKYGKSFYACDRFPKCKYAVNHPPQAQQCPACDWPVMVRRQTAKGEMLQCPQKLCQTKVTID